MMADPFKIILDHPRYSIAIQLDRINLVFRQVPRYISLSSILSLLIDNDERFHERTEIAKFALTCQQTQANISSARD